MTAEPEVGAEPDAVAELWAAAAGRATDHDGTEVLPPDGPARDAPPPKDE